MRRGRTSRTLLAVLLLAGAGLVAPAAGADPGRGVDRPSTESGGSDWRQFAVGFSHTCGIRTTGRLYCWGDDLEGQLGDGGASTDRSTPGQVAGNITNWATVTAGRFHTCARRATGRLYCWGRGSEGQLGNPGGSLSTPVEVAGASTNWSTIVAGDFHTCGRRTTGRLYCWGFDSSGQLGDGGTNTNQNTPVEVAGGVTTWTSVSGGRNHTCGRRTTGRLYCWGLDSDGQLGDGGTNTDRGAPVEVAGGVTTWAAVAAGEVHTCGRRTTGRLYCWGNDDFGRLGDGGEATNQDTPVQISGGATNWAVLDVGTDHTCARRATGRLYCWGRDGFGQLGDSGTNTDQGAPVEVTGGATDWAQLSVGGDHTCARITSGRLYCWGRDSNGELGDGGANADRIEPTPVRP